ncbi:hypothetical protein ACFJGV_17730 [Cnuibacter sp. UC19_7]|uniref:hypothetical protein n=1 Tax=Cnuibacter sp. UC19_7 TaxID=3350166 RepID=UPI00366F7681
MGGSATTGANSASLQLIDVLNGVMPSGSRVGQANCRRSAGTSDSWSNFTQFDDTCNHLHIDDF